MENIDEKIFEATAIADAISTIALCVQNTTAYVERDSGVADVLFGIRKLAETLGDELNGISYDLVGKGGDVA